MQSPLPQNNQPKRRRGLAGLIVGLVLIGLSVIVWVNQQYVADSISFWQYQPPAAVLAIAERSGLTDAGKFAFYAAQPSIEDSQTFNAKCDRKEQGTAILGCYAGNRIYIYDVTDERLNGIEEVTATHEMLHAVYQRLPADEKATVNRLVEAEYEKLQVDPAFAERMAFYARTEPGERDNELHSIIGTEISSIGGQLEQHYAKYFDRQNVLRLYQNYRGAFAALEQQRESLERQLSDLDSQRKEAVASYEADTRRLNADIAAFNQRANAGDFTTQAQFNAERAKLVARANALEVRRDALNKQVAAYNELVKQYNETIVQSNGLYQSIDSTVAPAPKV